MQIFVISIYLITALAAVGASSVAVAFNGETSEDRCAPLLAEMEISQIYRRGLEHVYTLEPEVTSAQELLHYLLQNGLNVKTIASETEFSPSSVYHWRSGTDKIPLPGFEYMLEQFDLIQPGVHARRVAAQRFAARLIPLAQSLHPMLSDLFIRPHDIIDVLTPMLGRRGAAFPQLAIHRWGERSLPMSDADLLKVAKLMAGKDADQIKRLRAEYLARRKMLGDNYNPVFSLRHNMAITGRALLGEFNQGRSRPYVAIDFLDVLVGNARTKTTTENLALRKHELLRYLLMDAQTLNAWQIERVAIGDHHLLGFLQLYTVLNTGRIEDVAALLDVDKARAREILKYSYR